MPGKADDVVIVGYARTPFDKFGGVCRDIPSAQLAEWTIRELLKRTGLGAEVIDDVNLGMTILLEAGTQTDVIARQALLRAGLRQETLSNTLDRACCSATTALQQSWKNLKLGEAEVSIAVGVDNMSRVPLYLPPKARWEGFRIGNMQLTDMLNELGIPGFGIVAVDAGEVAVEHGITREMQDEWAVRSHSLYLEALARGYIADEMFPLEIPQGRNKPPIVFDADAGPRPGTKVEALAKLSTVYGSPTVTGGNAPGLSTGAAGVIVTTREKAAELGLEVFATVVKVQSIAITPREIAVAPAVAIREALKTTGLTLDDLKVIEINEAFAAMPLVSTKLLGGGDEAKTQALRHITNIDGGAVALGHPVGASGLRITMHAMSILRRIGGGYGIAAICGGLAQGDAVVLRVD
ncbi:MAG: thiolase family protein [Firmicutes bacterium]|nr:thiolase family protein [Bacillota bacterium]